MARGHSAGESPLGDCACLLSPEPCVCQTRHDGAWWWLRVELHFSSGSPPSGLGSTGDKHAPRPHTRASGEDTRHRSQSQNPHRGHLTFGKARVSGEHAAQTIIPHFRQWCCGTTRVTKCGSAQRRRRTLPIPSMKPALHRAHPSTASFGSHIGREAVESHA